MRCQTALIGEIHDNTAEFVWRIKADCDLSIVRLITVPFRKASHRTEIEAQCYG
jgi:hypothetical protein